VNILNRLKKIESRIERDSAFCECPGIQKHEIIFRRDGINTIENPVAEFCDNCGKPIVKQIIIVNFVEAKNEKETAKEL
jgi:hypothetical protein